MQGMNKSRIRPLWLISFSLLSVSALAEKAVQETGAPKVSSLSNWPVVLLVLVGMVGFIFALAWFVKRFGGLNISGSRDMRIISTIPVGTRERIALLDVKGQQFLIGVTAHQISHLHSFDEAVVCEPKTESAFRQSDFLTKLQSVMNPQKRAQTSSPAPVDEEKTSSSDQPPTTKRDDDAR